MKSECILLVLAIFVSFFGCQSKGPATVPDELLGVWETSAPKYEDSFFRLTKDTLTFANRDLDYMDVNSISKIEKIHREKEFYIPFIMRTGKVKNTNSPFIMIH